jgi:hypothetical protein
MSGGGNGTCSRVKPDLRRRSPGKEGANGSVGVHGEPDIGFTCLSIMNKIWGVVMVFSCGRKGHLEEEPRRRRLRRRSPGKEGADGSVWCSW